MNKVKILKKSVTFFFGNEEFKFFSNGVTQAEMFVDGKCGVYFSITEGLIFVDLESGDKKLIPMISNCEFYTFQLRNGVVRIILAHQEMPEGERFWQHEIENGVLSERISKWR